MTWGGRRSTAEQVRARPDEHNQEKTQSFHLEAAFVKKEKKEKSVINFKSWSIEQLEETFIFNSRKKKRNEQPLYSFCFTFFAVFREEWQRAMKATGDTVSIW